MSRNGSVYGKDWLSISGEAVSDSLPENGEKAGCAGCEVAVFLQVLEQGKIGFVLLHIVHQGQLLCADC